MNKSGTLQEIVSDGYNMTVEAIEPNKNITIAISGSSRVFDLTAPLAQQINRMRISLGCTSLTDTDAKLINAWQDRTVSFH